MAIWTPILVVAATVLPLIAILAVPVAAGLVIWGIVLEAREQRAATTENVEHIATPVRQHSERIAEPRIA